MTQKGGNFFPDLCTAAIRCHADASQTRKNNVCNLRTSPSLSTHSWMPTPSSERVRRATIKARLFPGPHGVSVLDATYRQSVSHQSVSHQSVSHQSVSRRPSVISQQSVSQQSVSHQSVSHQSVSSRPSVRQSSVHQQSVVNVSRAATVSGGMQRATCRRDAHIAQSHRTAEVPGRAGRRAGRGVPSIGRAGDGRGKGVAGEVTGLFEGPVSRHY